MSKITLNDEQLAAIHAMRDFMKSTEHFFVLSGSAGTGKTTTLRELLATVRGRYLYTAPTNKATKVLRQTLSTPEHKPECRTIYSALGLRLEANGEVKELAVPEDPVDLTEYTAIIVDEGSMVNSALMGHIRRVAVEQDLQFIFLGDMAQLPPVGEPLSPVWRLDCPKAELTKVMRFDNALLTLATRLRGQIGHPAPRFVYDTDLHEGRGVHKVSPEDFRRQILDHADRGLFQIPDTSKAIAWRNVTVDKLNAMIRERIFAGHAGNPWVEDDRLILTAPAKDLEGEPMAMTDDEGRVSRVGVTDHPLYPEYKVWRLSVTSDENKQLSLLALHPESFANFARQKEVLAAEARVNRRRWKQYWDFVEAFHSVRHGYAITAHRSQGSTYETTFVDWKDILANQNRQEAFQCLYVANTRARDDVYL